MTEVVGTVLDEYIRMNTDFIPVVQLLMSGVWKEAAPKFELTGMPTRTLTQVFGEDFEPTISLIRKIYIPFYNAGERDTLTWAVNWVRKNRKEFGKVGIGDVGYEKIPIQVLLFYHTLCYMTAFGDGVGVKDPGEYRVPVAFRPDDPDFEKDIRRLTLAEYDKFRLLGLAMNKKANSSEVNSTSRSMYLMTRFFWSGGEDEYAIEAADLVTLNIFGGYFLALKSRYRAISVFFG